MKTKQNKNQNIQRVAALRSDNGPQTLPQQFHISCSRAGKPMCQTNQQKTLNHSNQSTRISKQANIQVSTSVPFRTAALQLIIPGGHGELSQE
jgi:hypothetical protein